MQHVFKNGGIRQKKHDPQIQWTQNGESKSSSENAKNGSNYKKQWNILEGHV